MKANRLTRPSGTKAASATLTRGTATRARASKAARAFAALPLTAEAARLLAAHDVRPQPAPQPAPLAGRYAPPAPLHDTAEQVRLACLARIPRDVPQVTTAGALALAERLARGTSDASATRRTRRTPRTLTLADLLAAASAQRALAPLAAAHRARLAALAEAETHRTALAAYEPHAEAPAPRAPKVSAEARAARDAALTSRERETLARVFAARKIAASKPDDYTARLRALTIAPDDLSRARAKARRTRRARGAMLALLTRHTPALSLALMARVRASRLGRLRLAWREAEAESAALTIARQRARIQTLGSVAVRARESGERIGRKVLRAHAPAYASDGAHVADDAPVIDLAGAFVFDAREGTGMPVEWQAIREMTLAARAEILAGNGWIAANKAARGEIHRALKEPSYASAEAASRANDRAHSRARDAWKNEECEPNAVQPASAESLAENDAEAEAPERAVIARWREARRAVRVYWQCAASNYATRGLRDDRAALRAMARGEIRGERALQFDGRKMDKAAEARYRNARNLAERVAQGRAILSRTAEMQRTARATERADQSERGQSCGFTAPAPLALWTLARGSAEVSAENWREQMRKGALPLAARLLAAAHARETHGSARGTASRASRTATRERTARAAQAAMRAPLAPSTLAALGKVRVTRTRRAK